MNHIHALSCGHKITRTNNNALFGLTKKAHQTECPAYAANVAAAKAREQEGLIRRAAEHQKQVVAAGGQHAYTTKMARIQDEIEAENAALGLKDEVESSYVCTICGHAFDSEPSTVVFCPKCGSDETEPEY